jgi:SAM-dependent methyltransferase
VKQIADVACGTGRHAAMFHSWGLEVEGSDISPKMIARARETFGEPGGLRWIVRGFDQPIAANGSFDAVVCLGNSLALAPNAAAASQALRHMFSATRVGGVVIVHVLNLWKLPPGPCVWQKITRKTMARGRVLIIKGVHRCQHEGFVELVVAADGDNDEVRTHSVRFLGLTTTELQTVARESAAIDVEFFGGYKNEPYEAEASTDLIMVARKSAPVRT